MQWRKQKGLSLQWTIESKLIRMEIKIRRIMVVVMVRVRVKVRVRVG